ncbi:unnamed protein product, partial [Mesorhabditis belari]|uniref:Saposin B-type domain-containing protein n=1 Tax=Mesorhabditis belari TaxID=2138241 RepID=A0AAF3F311_9BILA
MDNILLLILVFIGAVLANPLPIACADCEADLKRMSENLNLNNATWNEGIIYVKKVCDEHRLCTLDCDEAKKKFKPIFEEIKKANKEGNNEAQICRKTLNCIE